MPSNRCTACSINFPLLVKTCPLHEDEPLRTVAATPHDDWPNRVAKAKRAAATEAKDAERKAVPPIVRVKLRTDEHGPWVDSRDMIRAGVRVPVEYDGFVFETPSPLGPKLYEIVGRNEDSREFLLRPMCVDVERCTDWLDGGSE